jgi:hypothetical protein
VVEAEANQGAYSDEDSNEGDIRLFSVFDII